MTEGPGFRVPPRQRRAVGFRLAARPLGLTWTDWLETGVAQRHLRKGEKHEELGAKRRRNNECREEWGSLQPSWFPRLRGLSGAGLSRLRQGGPGPPRASRSPEHHGRGQSPRGRDGREDFRNRCPASHLKPLAVLSRRATPLPPLRHVSTTITVSRHPSLNQWGCGEGGVPGSCPTERGAT